MTGLVSVSTWISLMNSTVVFIPGVQFCPSLAGAGLSHLLVLVSVCCSLGPLQGVHSDQLPSAINDAHVKKDVMFKYKIDRQLGFLVCEE
jgi:hypothetical protein